MKKIVSILIICCFALLKVNSQTEVNSYKYIIVPLQYKFLKGENKYRLNTLTKHLFLKSGYEVYYDKQLIPADLFEDRCLAMYADVNEIDRGFRITNLEIELRDCKGELILKSDIGRSGINNHEKRFTTALRNAYDTFSDRLFYQETAKSTSTEEKVVDNKTSDKPLVKSDVTLDVYENSKKVVETKDTNEKEAESTTEITAGEQETVEEASDNEILYAQEVDNGYQLVNSESKVVMVLLKTGLDDVFNVKGNDAIIFKKDGDWMYSENKENGVKLKPLNIKF
ncbi:hypothetical protein [Winogradskyella sp. KYW1333]|uniref:hypothetical protein n=1 Tax=Winogradskyella sp. KYW1333 TaxID=2282123 RepID=UPI000DF37755|nr:hypothetical protein [Winogradskyella sp. KYW1333]RCT55878.1 hypothetical protein DUZ96_02010 [Winogradskyella sp. KYW1333]